MEVTSELTGSATSTIVGLGERPSMKGPTHKNKSSTNFVKGR